MFSTLQHKWAGKVTVLDDCTFRVDNFVYDGQGPNAFFWASDGTSRSSLLNGFALHSSALGRATGNSVTVTLPQGVTWDDVPVLSGWCIPFKALFGLVDLRVATTPAPPATTAPVRTEWSGPFFVLPLACAAAVAIEPAYSYSPTPFLSRIDMLYVERRGRLRMPGRHHKRIDGVCTAATKRMRRQTLLQWLRPPQ